MARTVVVDTGFLVALLNRRDADHSWAVAEASRLPPPWMSCDAVLSEAFHLLGVRGGPVLGALLRRRALISAFHLHGEENRVVSLMHKYAALPMSLADACLVRMTETLADPIVLTTDADFRIYRRHGRQAVPSSTPR